MQPPVQVFGDGSSDSQAEGYDEQNDNTCGYMYKLLDLSQNSVRLVDIIAPAKDGTLRAELRSTELRPPRRRTEFYTALSYAWGPKYPQLEININGACMRIGANLYELLVSLMNSHFRHTDRMSMESLWIDAICIDQNNAGEKNHQVSLMGQIYSHATKVIVWLGAAPPACDVLTVVEKAVEKRAEKDSLCLRYYFDSKDFDSILRDALDDLRNIGIMASVRSVLEAVHVLSTAPYWQRLWIMQEVRLARDRRVLFGRSSITWIFWQKVYQMYASAFDRPCFVPSNLIQLSTRTFGAGYAIEHLLEACKQAKCHDIRDRLFGVLSLTEDGADFPVNYDDEPSRVISRAMQHFRRSDPNTLFGALNESLDWPVDIDAAWPLLDHLVATTFVWPPVELEDCIVTTMSTIILSWAERQSSGAALGTYCLDFIWLNGFLREIRLGYCCRSSCLPAKPVWCRPAIVKSKVHNVIPFQRCEPENGWATFSICCSLAGVHDHTHSDRAQFKFIMATRLSDWQSIAILKSLLANHIKDESLAELASYCDRCVLQAKYEKLEEAKEKVEEATEKVKKLEQKYYEYQVFGDSKSMSEAALSAKKSAQQAWESGNVLLRRAKDAVRIAEKQYAEFTARRHSLEHLHQILEPYASDLKSSFSTITGRTATMKLAWINGVFDDSAPAHLLTVDRSLRVKAPKQSFKETSIDESTDWEWELRKRPEILYYEPVGRARRPGRRLRPRRVPIRD